mgnify:CR=1 FL=1
MQSFIAPDHYYKMRDNTTFTLAANYYEIKNIIKTLLPKHPSLSTLHIGQARSQYKVGEFFAFMRHRFSTLPRLESSESDLVQTKLLNDREVFFTIQNIRAH